MRSHHARLWCFALLGPAALSPVSLWAGPRDKVTSCADYSDLASLADVSPVLPASDAAEAGPWVPIATGPPVVTHAMVYDAGQRRVLVLGGGGAAYENSVWALPLQGPSVWSRLEVSGQPPVPRRSLVAVYDPPRRRVIVYGGYDGTFLNDLWELKLEPTPTWAALEAAGELPPPLAGSAALFDPVRERMLVIQGNDGAYPGSRRSEVWALSLSGRPIWSVLHPAGRAPEARSGHSAVYDQRRDRVILFGGTTPRFKNDVWELRLAGEGAWRQIEISGPCPSPREEQAAVLDPVHDELVIHGGTRWDNAGDAWALSLGDTHRWRSLSVLRASVLGCWGHRAVFDPVGSRMVIHGGWGLGPTTIALDLGAPTADSILVTRRVSADSGASTAMEPARLRVEAPAIARGRLAARLFLPGRDGVRLELFDVDGRRIAWRDVTGLGPGVHGYRWEETANLPSGVYWLRIRRGSESATAKTVLLR